MGDPKCVGTKSSNVATVSVASHEGRLARRDQPTQQISARTASYSGSFHSAKARVKRSERTVRERAVLDQLKQKVSNSDDGVPL